MTIMSRRGAKGGEQIAGPAPMQMSEMKSEGGEIDGRHSAAQDMIAAMHEKSPEKMVGAMSNFIDMHMAMDHGDEGDDEPSVE